MFMKRLRLILFISGALILLTACNFPGSSAQPTNDLAPVYTAAAQTLVAQQTQAAQGTPNRGCGNPHFTGGDLANQYFPATHQYTATQCHVRPTHSHTDSCTL